MEGVKLKSIVKTNASRASWPLFFQTIMNIFFSIKQKLKTSLFYFLKKHSKKFAKKKVHLKRFREFFFSPNMSVEPSIVGLY